MKVESTAGTSSPVLKMRRISSLALLLVFVACTEDKKMDELTETEISAAAGGTAKSSDGKLTLRIPAGALAQDTKIRIEILRDGGNQLIRSYEGQAKAVEYDLQPSGISFAMPVDIEIDTGVDAGDDELVLALLPEPGHQGEPQMLESSIHDPTTFQVKAQLEHFSRYGVFRRANACAGLSCGDPCGNGRQPRRCNFNNRCVPAALPLFCGGGNDGGPVFDAGVPDATPDGSVFPPGDGGVFGGDGGVFRSDGGDAGPNLLYINELEPNDPVSNAQYLPVPCCETLTVVAEINPSSDEDWYWFEVPQGFNGSLHSITHSDPSSLGACTGIDTQLELYDSSLTLWARNDDSFGTRCAQIGWDFNPAVTTLPAGVYYLKVTSFGGVTSFPYYLTLAVDLYFPGQGDGGNVFLDGGGHGSFDTGVAPDAGRRDAGQPFDAGIIPDGGGGGFDGNFGPDAGLPPSDGGVSLVQETEPNNNIATANPIPYQLVTQFTGMFSPAGDVDYVQVVIRSGAVLSIFAQTYTDPLNLSCTPRIDTVLDLLDGNGAVLATNDDYVSQIGCSRIDPQIHQGARFLPPGFYYVRARHFANQSSGPYYIHIELQ